MLYTRVYAPDGEPFDVVRDVADNLLLNLGWTQTVAEISTPAAEDVSTPSSNKNKRESE